MRELVCALCGRRHDGESTADLTRADRRGWNWWTGWNVERQSACPSCNKGRGAEVRRLIADSRSAQREAEFKRLREEKLIRYEAGHWVYARREGAAT